MVTNQKNSPSQFIKSVLTDLPLPKVGSVIEGRVLGKKQKRIFLDLDKYGTGIVKGKEFLNAKSIIKKLKENDKISGKIIDFDNEEGFIELSLTEANRQKVWEELKELVEKGETVKVKVSGFNRGGLTTKIKDLSAFLPVSQFLPEHLPRNLVHREELLEALKKMMGLDLEVKIIDLNQKSSKIILSEKEVAHEGVRKLIAEYKPGQIITGIISGIADFGVFVKFINNPAIEGLIHISELDHRLIDNPKEIVELDKEVKAQIIEIKNGKIFLSLKALKPNPWDKVEEKYRTAQEVKGKVYKFSPFGVFINLDNEIFGLIHVSEFGSVEEMKKQLKLNEEYEFVITALKPEAKRLLLKLKK